MTEEDNWRPQTTEELCWLVSQLRRWPARVHPDRTTNLSFIMGAAANVIADEYDILNEVD